MKKIIYHYWLVMIVLMLAGAAISVQGKMDTGEITEQSTDTCWHLLEGKNSGLHDQHARARKAVLEDDQSPVEVRGNAELAAVASSGSGKEEDPYILGGWNISVSTSMLAGVYIYGTSSHFVIRDCWIDGGSRGIFIKLVASGTAKIVNNTCKNNDIAIHVHGSSSTVINNTCENNSHSGISLWSSPSSTVINNTFIRSGLGMNGSLSDILPISVVNNRVNGLPLGFLTNQGDGSVKPGYGQLIMVNCTDMTVENQNYSNTSAGIGLYHCSRIKVINNTCENNSDGILLHGSSSCTVTSNTCNNSGCGINLWDSPSSTVASNTCENNSIGINLGVSPSSTVINNTCKNNSLFGITLHSSSSCTVASNIFKNDNGIFLWDSSSSTVASNTCGNNSYSYIFLNSTRYSTVTNNALGIALSGSSHSAVINNTCKNNSEGISLWFSPFSTVANNTCKNNRDGIVLYESDSTVVSWNLITGNREYGIHVESSLNTLHHNYFLNNSVQAVDNGTSNQWYDTDTGTGNFWSDHRNTSPYQVPGSAGSTDPFPILDNDGDGMADWWEYLYGLDFFDPADSSLDLDGDLLTNVQEFGIGSHPSRNDTDFDGMHDYYEWLNGLNCSFDDADADRDGDGLTNLEEFKLGTKANDVDSDSDGMDDYYEVLMQLNPHKNDADLDHDNDTMTNIWEYEHGLNASDSRDADDDPDGDWITNVNEFLGGSDPNNPLSVPLFSFSILHAGVFLTVFVTVTGLYYRQKKRKSLITRFSAPDHATAVKIKKTGLADYRAFVQAEKEINELIEQGNAALLQGDLAGAGQKYEQAVLAAGRLGNDFLLAGAVFRLARLQKEQQEFTASSPVLDHFPRRSRGDLRVEVFGHMIQALLAETEHNWGTARKAWQAALDAGGIDAAFRSICRGALVETDVRNWLNNPATSTAETLVSRLEEWREDSRIEQQNASLCQAYLLQARVTLASFQLDKTEECLKQCLTAASELDLPRYVDIAREELKIFSEHRERMTEFLKTATELTPVEQERRIQGYIKIALKSLEKEGEIW